MTRKQLEEELRVIFERVIKTVMSKNQDYAGEDDLFKNFRFAELVGVPVHRAMLVRMSDKLARISNVVDKDVAVKNEKVSDTLEDNIGYSALLEIYLKYRDGN